MLVFGTEIHIVTFLILLLELVFFCYQIVHYLSRPSDKHRLYYLILLSFLILHNFVGGLFPDKNINIPIITQNIIAYAVPAAMSMYFPFYFYKAFDLTKLKFYAYGGSVLFILVPFILFFIVPYYITHDLELSKELVLIIPSIYALSFVYSLNRAIKIKNETNKESSKTEIIGMYVAVICWITLPIIAIFETKLNTMLEPVLHFYNGSQVVEVTTTNSGLFVMTILFIRKSVKQSRSEYDKLLASEKELQELNAGLTIKVQERTKELELANEQRTNTFINLTHETKTPLTLINNYLDEYIQKNGQTKELKVIKSNIEKLTQDVVNFFDMERIQKGLNVYDNNKITYFSKMLRDNIVLFKQYGNKKNIEIVESIEDNVYIKADPESLYRIVNNLIENSIKYTSVNGKVEVSLKCLNDRINFSVKDNGIGISPDLHEKIFEPYYQINSEKKNYQGMGLGLSIVRKITDSLNGKIIVISDPQKSIGTEITVELPVHKILNGEVISEFKNNNIYHLEPEQLCLKEDEYDEAKATIMVVEDNIPLLNYMGSKLQEKYNIRFAVSGNEALEKLKTIRELDLIVSDVMMDHGDGLDFYKGVSLQKRFSHIPFIFLTAKTNFEDKMLGLSLGAMDYISKPFHINELTTKIDTVLNKFSKQRETLIHNIHRTLLHQNGAGTFEENCNKFNLTSREKEIVQLIAKGQTYKEIANTLHISDKTVGKHIENMFEKVGAGNRSELVNRLGASASV